MVGEFIEGIVATVLLFVTKGLKGHIILRLYRKKVLGVLEWNFKFGVSCYELRVKS